jgi:hypothetical protein
LCRDYTPRPLTASDAVSFYRTTAPDTMVSGAYEAFACVVSVTSGQLIEIREKITRSGTGGLREEGEETRPELLPLADIIDGGGISIISHVVVEFMRGFGISVPSKKQILPLPYIRLRE